MKKLGNVIGLVLMTMLVFGLVACKQEAVLTTSSSISSTTDGGVSVYGQFSGVVLNGRTDQPLSGVKVTIGNKSATTGADGCFFIDDVIPGTYTVVYTKSGYLAATVEDVVVNAGQKKEDDPNAEYEVLKELLAAFVKYTESDNFDWSSIRIEDGKIITESTEEIGTSTESDVIGDATITENAILTKTELTDCIYKYGITLGAKRLAPLSASIHGNIKLLSGNYFATDVFEEVCPEGVEITLVAIDYYGGSSYSYKSTKTDKNGNYKFEKLPAGYYFGFLVEPINDFAIGEKLYSYSGDDFGLTGYFTMPDGGTLIDFPMIADYDMELNLALYPLGDDFITTETNAGYFNALKNGPLGVYDDVTIAFSSSVNTETIKFVFDEKDVELIPTWDIDNKVVTLSLPKDVAWNWGDSSITLYNATNTIYISPVIVDDYVLDVNGSVLDENYNAISVFTESELKLEEIEFLTKEESISRAISINKNELPFQGAIKLTFNKEIDSECGLNKFDILADTGKIGAADVEYDGSVIYVSLDKVPTYAQDLSLDLEVRSTSYRDYNEDFCAEEIEFHTVDGLSLVSTNLYGDVFNVYYDFNEITLDDLAVFPTKGKIELVFDEDLTDFDVSAELYEEDLIQDATTITDLREENLIASEDIVVDGTKITITPKKALYNSNYALAVKIEKDGIVYFNTRSEVFAYYNGYVVDTGVLTKDTDSPLVVVGNNIEEVNSNSYYIRFFTEAKTIDIVNTNIYNYILSNEIADAADTKIISSDDIVLTFDESLDGCKVNAVLVPAVIVNSYSDDQNLIDGITINDNEVLINHKVLYAETQYALFMEIKNKDGYIIYTTDGVESTPYVAYDEGYGSIVFNSNEGLFELAEFSKISLDGKTTNFPVFDSNGNNSVINLYFNDNLDDYEIETSFSWSQDGNTLYPSDANFIIENDIYQIKSALIVEPVGTLVPGMYYHIGIKIKDEDGNVIIDTVYKFKTSDDFIYLDVNTLPPVQFVNDDKTVKTDFEFNDTELDIELDYVEYNYSINNIYRIFSAKAQTNPLDNEWILCESVNQDSYYDLKYNGKYVNDVDLASLFVNEDSGSSWLVDGGEVAVMYQVTNKEGFLEQSDIITYADNTAPELSVTYTTPFESKYYDDSTSITITVKSKVENDKILVVGWACTNAGVTVANESYNDDRTEYSFNAIIADGTTVNLATDELVIEVVDMAGNIESQDLMD